MPDPGSRWQEIGETRFPHEREALDYVRERLPDWDPFRAFALFEFVAGDGSINEIDLLVIAPAGIFLVEIKSWPGEVDGDQRDWVVEFGGRRRALENPLFLTDRKAKRLRSLLDATTTIRRGKEKVPFIQPLVFLSHPDLVCRLAGVARNHVYLRDESPEARAREGIITALTATPGRDKVDRPRLKVLLRALHELGIRPQRRQRMAGDYVLSELLGEGRGWQDFLGTHRSLGEQARVRMWTIDQAADLEQSEAVRRAARREYALLRTLTSPGVDAPRMYTDTDTGPALIYGYDASDVRLDTFLADRSDRLGLDDRLDLVRQLAETLAYTHRHGVVHRALCPASIFVHGPETTVPFPRIRDWHAGFALDTSAGHTRAGTAHIDLLLDDPARCYLAPEASTGTVDSGVALDVFGFGAVAFQILTGTPPAMTPLELVERSRTGLSLSSVVDGIPPLLEQLIATTTLGDVSARLDSMEDVVTLLNDVYDELTRPDEPEVTEAAIAGPGSHLGSGVTVVERVGAGATAFAFRVRRDGQTSVLKTARSGEFDERLRDEADVLSKLSHACIVRLLAGPEEIGSREALFLQDAGPVTLARELRDRGRLHVDMLERWGADLLEALAYLESMGVHHRDVKPDNLGVAERPGNRERHLVLFDFSLARVPLSDTRAGTTGYVDPFLPGRGQWDLHADRWSAAVTLFQMATGELPRFGDGRSDPSAIDTEATVDPTSFESALAEPLSAFFADALRRDAKQRFGSAEEMLRAWRRIFDGANLPIVPRDDDESTEPQAALIAANLDDAVISLGVSARVVDFLDRLGASHVRDLLEIDVAQLSHTGGAANQTRRAARGLVLAARDQFPDELARLSSADDDSLGIDQIVQRLIPRSTAQTRQQERFARTLLGLVVETTIFSDEAISSWAPLEQTARALEIDAETAESLMDTARNRWQRLPALTVLRAEIARAISTEGGLMTTREVAAFILSRRGALAVGAERTRSAEAVIRAAVEAEGGRLTSRFSLSIDTATPILIQTLDASDQPIDSASLAGYAVALGERADRLALADPPLPATRAIDDLREEDVPDSIDLLPDSRLVRLAVAVSAHAAVSARLEIYEKHMPTARALGLARGVLLTLSRPTPEDIARRVSNRFPDAEPLPARPALDDLLTEAGFDLVWSPTGGHYEPRTQAPSAHTHPSTRLPTTLGALPLGASDPSIADANAFEQRLKSSLRHGGFLCLIAPPSHYLEAIEGLERRFDPTTISVDALLISRLHNRIAAAGATWEKALSADASSHESADWSILRDRLAGPSADDVATAILETTGTVLITDIGLLVRYGRLAIIERIRDAAGTADAPLKTAWLVIPGEAGTLPSIDGDAIPVIGSGQYAPVPTGWIANRHRARIGEPA